MAARLRLAEVADAAGAERLLQGALVQPGLAELELDGVLPSDLGPGLVRAPLGSHRRSVQTSFRSRGLAAEPKLADQVVLSNLGLQSVHLPYETVWEPARRL